MNKKRWKQPKPTPSAIRRRRQKMGLTMLMGREHVDLLMGERLSYLSKADLDALTELVFGQQLPDPPGYSPRG